MPRNEKKPETTMIMVYIKSAQKKQLDNLFGRKGFGSRSEMLRAWITEKLEGERKAKAIEKQLVDVHAE